ncbi:MAG: hypothetical protein GXY03_09770 [Solirubrobacterales bacterium]|nr:hypothetical protein [Solirubrobacterales bacterium]
MGRTGWRAAAARAVAALGATAALALGGGERVVAAEVTVRIEGSSATLFDGPVTVGDGPVDGGDGSGPHACGGGGPSLAGALDAAATRAGMTWRGGWNPDFGDFFVERIGPDASDHGRAAYWAALIDWRYAGGACQTPVAAGAEVLWAYDTTARPAVLRLAGTDRATVGTGVAFTVRDGWLRADSGEDGGPVAGAAVTAAPAVGGRQWSATTGPDGTATLAIDTPGEYRVTAAAPAAVRSNAVALCVGDELCAGRPPQGGVAPPTEPSGPARGGTPPPAGRVLARSLRYLLAAQRRGGGFPLSPGATAAATSTAWATVALGAAVGRGPARPRSRRRAVRGPLAHRVERALRRARRTLARAIRAPAATAAELARTAVALRAAGGGRAARRLARRRLAARQRSDGSFAGDVNVTAYALIALRGGRRHAEGRRAARRWLLARGATMGGFAAAGHGAPDPDTTGAVLWAAGRRGNADAVRWLDSRRGPAGGFAAFPGAAANGQSTALAALGLARAGRDPRRPWGGGSPAHFLRTLANPDGAIAYAAGDRRTPVWTTSQAVAALVAAGVRFQRSKE